MKVFFNSLNRRIVMGGGYNITSPLADSLPWS